MIEKKKVEHLPAASGVAPPVEYVQQTVISSR